MNDNKDQSPFGRGFIAACIVIGAVLLCGALVLITGLTSGGTTQVASAGEPAQTTSTPRPSHRHPPARPGRAWSRGVRSRRVRPGRDWQRL